MIIQDEDDDSFEEFDFEIIDEIVAKETQTTSDLKQLEESEKQLLIGEIYVIRKSLDETITENKELKLKAAQGMIDLNKNVSELKQIHDREIEKLKTQLQFKQNEYRKLEESISMNNSTARVSVPSSPIVPVTIVPKKRKDDDGFLTMKTFGSTSFKKISKTGAMDGIKIERIVENEIIDDNLDFPMELFDEIPDPIENNPEIVMQHEESINEIPSNTPLLFKEHVQETTSLNDNNDTFTRSLLLSILKGPISNPYNQQVLTELSRFLQDSTLDHEKITHFILGNLKNTNQPFSKIKSLLSILHVMISSSSKFRQVFLNLIEYHYTLLTILTDCNFELTFIIYDCFKTITWEICESNRSLDKEKLNCFLSGQVLKTMLETHESTESLEKFLDWISLMISGDTKAYDILFSIQDNHIILIASCNLVSHSNSRLVFSVTRFLLIMLSSGMKQTIEICIKYRLDTLYPLILYIDKVVGSCFESIKRDHVPILKNILLFINSMAFNDARIISRQDINGLGGDWFELLVNGLLRITSEIEELGDLSRDMLAGMLIPEDYKILFA